jgi:hypothetical protein
MKASFVYPTVNFKYIRNVYINKNCTRRLTHLHFIQPNMCDRAVLPSRLIFSVIIVSHFRKGQC